MKRPIIEVINSYFPSLTNSEKKVANYVLNNLQNVMYYSLNDLAEEAGVGETTVLRFCKKIGLEGYQELKLNIAQTLADNNSESLSKSSNLLQMVLNDTISTLQKTEAMNSEKDIEKAIDLLNDARMIHFFGVGTSGITALDAKSRLLRIGRHSEVITDSHLQAMSAATLTEEDVVIGLSISGSTRDTIEALEIAKENGAKIIAMTYFSRSPITQLADVVLIAGAKESPLEGSSLTGKISQLYVIDLLCTGLALKEKEKSQMMKNKTAQAVVNKIY